MLVNYPSNRCHWLCVGTSSNRLQNNVNREEEKKCKTFWYCTHNVATQRPTHVKWIWFTFSCDWFDLICFFLCCSLVLQFFYFVMCYNKKNDAIAPTVHTMLLPLLIATTTTITNKNQQMSIWLQQIHWQSIIRRTFNRFGVSWSNYLAIVIFWNIFASKAFNEKGMCLIKHLCSYSDEKLEMHFELIEWLTVNWSARFMQNICANVLRHSARLWRDMFSLSSSASILKWFYENDALISKLTDWN